MPRIFNMPPRGIGQELLDVPFPEMIRSMGLAIAEAQYALDEAGIRLAQMMSGRFEVEIIDPITGEVTTETKEALVTFDGEEMSLLELGFTPTFYQFVDTLIEVKIAISMSTETSYSRSRKTFSASAFGGGFLGFGGAKMKATSVNARYASKFQYTAEGSSLLRTKLVPVPSPAVLEERIRVILEKRKEENA
jgi:hypothetical protein